MPPGLELTTPEIIPQAPLQYRRMLHGAGNLLNALRRTAIGGASPNQTLLSHPFRLLGTPTKRRYNLLLRVPHPRRGLGKTFLLPSRSAPLPKNPRPTSRPRSSTL